ncbi:hypothetical protein GEMRC1_010282 [Eukaryota sp. GEM-RC1]
MNLYFLVLATLQLNPTLTPVNPITTWLPLLLTLAIAGTKEIYDDISRWKQDRKTNLRRYFVSNGQSFVLTRSQDIRVGDIIQIRENEEIPADIVLLKSSEQSSRCFVNTANIDGELLASKAPSPSPPPNNNFSSFDAVINIGKNKYSLSCENLLLQATSLAATNHIFGVVVYVGNKTKYGLSKKKAPTKWTRIDSKINKYTACIWVAQLCLALSLGVIGNSVDPSNHWYLFSHLPTSVFLLPDWAVIPLRFLLLCSLLIPISLKVTLDVAKLIYAKYIQWDSQMVCPRGGNAVARSTAISEDLGQIEYVFADKTGTLTENKMVFHSAAVGDYIFSSLPSKSPVRPLPDVLTCQRGPEFARALALCNSVDTLYNGKNSMPLYRAASPDEKALVLASKDMGIVLKKRLENGVVVGLSNGDEEEYEVLAVLPFSSDRKRMGVLVRRTTSSQSAINQSESLFFVKGADDVVFPMTVTEPSSSSISKNLDNFASSGLRTLAIAFKRVSPSETSQFLRILEDANTSMTQREDKVEHAYALLERSLTLLGATAIEDSLQPAVCSTISWLREAGVKVWMLTGDKGSTAIQVGVSTNLITVNETRSISDSVRTKKIMSALSKSSDKKFGRSLVLQGSSLSTLLSPSVLPLFISVCDRVESVICSRLTPTQKSDVVATFRNYKKAVVLAIGDGGNDVPMINAANIGVGIKGREGLAAAGAADYAIGQFRFLTRLMGVQGVYSLRRTAFITMFSFWKSMIIAFQQLTFAFFSMFSGTSYFDTFALSTWNIIFTSFPVLMYVIDRNVEPDQIMRNPYFYKQYLRNDVFSPRVFFFWVVRALWQGLCCILIAVGVYGSTYVHPSTGISTDYYTVPIVSFTSAMAIHTFAMVMESSLLTWVNSFFIFGSFLVLPLTLVLFSFTPTSDLFDVQLRLFMDFNYYLTVLVTTVIAMAPVLFFRYFNSSKSTKKNLDFKL